MFKLKMETGNAAFADNIKHLEVARILRNVVEKLEADHTEGKLIDLNGNTVGEWKLL